MKEMILEFYKKYANYAYRVALVHTNNEADAEDLSQEVVLKIIRNKDILSELINKDESQAKGYLARAVVNMTIEQYRKSSSRIKREQNVADKRMVAIDETAPHDGITDDNKHSILKAVKDLPEKYQTIIMLKFYEGHSNSELSNMLNLKEVSIRSLISRAISKLKNRLAVMGVMLSGVSITQNLEATELVSVPSELNTKLMLSIQNNYQAIPLASGSIFNFKLIGVLFLSVFAGFAVFKYDFLFLKDTASKQVIQTMAVKPEPLYSFALDMRHVTSEEELVALVESKLDIKDNKNFVISYAKKGISTVGSKAHIFEFPYILTPDKPIMVTCEVNDIRKSRNTHLGVNLELFSITEGLKSSMSEGEPFFMKAVILDRLLFIDFTGFASTAVHKLGGRSYFVPFSLKAQNVNINQMALHEMNPEEVKAFREKNADVLRSVETLDADEIEKRKKWHNSYQKP